MSAAMSRKARNLVPAATASSRLVRTATVAEMLGVSPWRVRQLVVEGVLTPVRFGERGKYRFRVADVERLIEGESAP
jgi:excisionase family DNA binding protein